jgi:citrate lyase subunit beta / citryl-CoA lyase
MAPHPELALKPPGAVPPLLPACAHYAGNEKFIRKVAALRVERALPFDITCDCEDGAPVGREREHVRALAALILELAPSNERFGVRIHDVSTAHWYEEIDVLLHTLRGKLAYLTLPKIDSLAQLTMQVNHLRAVEQQLGLSAAVPVHVMIESQEGVRNVDAIAAHPRVQAVDFGVMDFVSDYAGAIPIAAIKSPAQFDHPLMRKARTEIVSAALRYGKVPADSVTIEFTKPEQALNDATRARQEFAYLRKHSVHPEQIEPILRGMQPSADELQFASGVLRAGHAAHWGPIRFEDELHDRASFRYYWQLLKRARMAGARLDASAEAQFFSVMP